MKTADKKPAVAGADTVVVDVTLTLTKTTKGTHVLGSEDEEVGIKGIYIPKEYFTKAGVDPTGKKFSLVITATE
jgi:hypothetical protein